MSGSLLLIGRRIRIFEGHCGVNQGIHGNGGGGLLVVAVVCTEVAADLVLGVRLWFEWFLQVDTLLLLDLVLVDFLWLGKVVVLGQAQLFHLEALSVVTEFGIRSALEQLVFHEVVEVVLELFLVYAEFKLEEAQDQMLVTVSFSQVELLREVNKVHIEYQLVVPELCGNKRARVQDCPPILTIELELRNRWLEIVCLDDLLHLLLSQRGRFVNGLLGLIFIEIL